MSAAALPKARLPRQLARLNAITKGPGALHIPSTVSAINLSFKLQNSNGHMGPRKFWRENLPRIQFYNPSLPISVSRQWATTSEEHAKIPATLTVAFADGTSKNINAQYKMSEDILNELILLTGAKEVPEEEQVFIEKPRRK